MRAALLPSSERIAGHMYRRGGKECAGFIFSHMIHHRAQLGVYLRLLDIPVPSMYGNTADEAGF